MDSHDAPPVAPPADPSGANDALRWDDVTASSLRFRLTVVVTLALSVILAAFLTYHYREHRNRTLREAERSLVTVGRLISGSLEHAMLTQNHAELQEMMDGVARNSDIRFMVLLNRRAEVRFAPGRRDVGKRLDLREPGCQVCHAQAQADPGLTVVTTDSQGEPVLRNCTPIANEPQCYGCHDPQRRINGALLTDFSTAELNEHLAADLRANVIGGFSVVLVIAIMVNALLDRMVLARLEQVVRAMRAFGGGDRARRAPVRDADEISRLARAFNEMADGLQAKETETSQLYHELQHKEVARAQLLQQILQVQEEERKRIARELHDDFAQTLTALSINLETAKRALPETMAALGRQLGRVQELTMATLGQTHRWIQDLRPRVLDDLGLLPALRWYAETRLEAEGIATTLEVNGFRGRLRPELETALFRVIQEALNNVAKHARAQHVRIRLEFSGDAIRAEVEDDGVGFDPATFETVRDDMRGIGLVGMRERMTLVGGDVTIDSAPGRGTRVRIEAPWQP